MDENKKLIWAFHSMKKGTFDNDYYFYEDGTIIHRYDISVRKFNLEKQVSSEDISDYEMKKIIEQCEKECNSDVVKQIRTMLKLNN